MSSFGYQDKLISDLLTLILAYPNISRQGWIAVADGARTAIAINHELLQENLI
jgi:hypothetical protein